MRAAVRSVAHVATKLCSVPCAAASQHQDQLPLALGTQPRWFSATANKLSVPSTSVPAQGGGAQAAVKAEERADALEAEKVVLKKQIASLEEHCFGERRAEVTKQLRDLRIFVPATVEGAEAKLTELKEDLKSANRRLETAERTYADLVAMQRVQQELAERFKFEFRVNETQERPAYRGAEEAKDAVTPYIKGALRIGTKHDEKVAWYEANKKNSARIFASIGQMGKGKTRLQYELCRQSAGRKLPGEGEEAIKMDFGATHVNFVRLMYNEGFQSEALPGVTTTIFGRNLLMCNGMSSEDAGRVQSLDEAVELLYRKLTWRPGKAQALVVCVDEFLSLRTGTMTDTATARGELMRELVVFQEKSCEGDLPTNRVVFLFAAVTEAMVRGAAQVSGRELCTRNVPTLGEEDALNMLFELRPDLEARYKTDTQFQQLVHLCLARPRALFVGLLDAYPVWKKGQKVRMTDALREVALSNSVNEALRYRYLEEEEVQSWLTDMSLSGTPKRKELQKQWGVTAPGGAALDPLTLRYWCEVWNNKTWEDLPGKAEKILPVARYLRKAYMADTKVTKTNSKIVEEVLCNFEAAKRVSYKGSFTLSEYYRGGTIKGGLEKARVCAFPGDQTDRPDDLVKTVANFRGKTDVSALLEEGCVVSSEKVTVIEYLVPFFHPERRTLDSVAAVQVKYGPRHKKDKDYKDICDKVMKLPIIKHLVKKEKVTCFPVVFSTLHDDVPEDADKVEHGVLYNEAAMIEFTECLGPLRYHREASATQIVKIRKRSIGPEYVLFPECLC